MKAIKLPLLILLITFLVGCAKNVPLNSSHADQIKTTKMIIVKKQTSLQLDNQEPMIAYAFDPMTMLIATGVANVLNVAVFQPRERAAFAPISKDLENYNVEDHLLKSLNTLVENKHFKFTTAEIVNVEKDKELPIILQNTNSEHVAFLVPTYKIDKNMSHIFMECELSVYNKSGKWKDKTVLPEPIYQTTVKYKYTLPEAGWFSHVNNAKRWQQENSALMIKTLNNGVAQLSGDLITKVEQPFG